MELDEIAQVLSGWATSNPLVSKIWLFGSRVRGTCHSESDIDVAVELDLAFSRGVDESGGLATWMHDTHSWQDEIQALVPYKLDLHRYGGIETPTISKALQRSSILVYDKSEPNRLLLRTDLTQSN
jgi:predicted nucleotidyltransferase